MFDDIRKATDKAERELQVELQRGAARERELRDEVAGLKTFLSTHDASDSGQIISSLDKINNLLHEFASNVSLDDMWITPQGHVKQPEAFAGLHDYLKPVLSPVFLQILSASNAQDTQSTPIIFQYAIKAAVLRQVSDLLCQFCCGLDDASDRLLRALAEATLQREIQPIYGQWRSVLHQSARSSIAPQQYKAFLHQQIEKTATNTYYSGCIIYGFPINQDHFQPFYEGYHADIKEIFESAIKLSQRLREDIVTRDYLPFTAVDLPFDSQEAKPAHAVKSLPPEDPIAGCSRLGLYIRFKQGRERSSVQEQISRRPYVVTNSMLSELVSSSQDDRKSSKSSPVARTRPPTSGPSKLAEVLTGIKGLVHTRSASEDSNSKANGLKRTRSHQTGSARANMPPTQAAGHKGRPRTSSSASQSAARGATSRAINAEPALPPVPVVQVQGTGLAHSAEPKTAEPESVLPSAEDTSAGTNSLRAPEPNPITSPGPTKSVSSHDSRK